MGACRPLHFDFGECFFGWVPDWVWAVFSWWPWILGTIGLLAVLGVLYRIKMVFGWPGVAAALGFGLFATGYVLGRRSGDPVEGIDEDSADAQPSVARNRPKNISGKRRRYNFDTNQFEDY